MEKCIRCGSDISITEVCIRKNCILNGFDTSEEDVPLLLQYARDAIVKRAISAADRIIMDGSDGSVEETDYLTAAVMLAFVQKTQMQSAGRLLRKDMEDKHEKKVHGNS